MRNMAFSLTTQQYRDGTKDVTRRFGWRFLRPGDLFVAVEKGMGLARGAKVIRMGLNETVSVREEPLEAITADDCRREGFPHLSPAEFVEMLCRHSGRKPTDRVNRIEFRRIMQLFAHDQVRPARAYAADGGVALQIWWPPEAGWPGAPAVFQREAAAGRPWAHLFDRNGDRLRRIATGLGIRQIVLHKAGTGRQHVDLCARPLALAIEMAITQEPAARNLEPGVTP